jgi:hypothetical protein
VLLSSITSVMACDITRFIKASVLVLPQSKPYQVRPQPSAMGWNRNTESSCGSCCANVGRLMWSQLSIFPILFVLFSTYFFYFRPCKLGITTGMLFLMNNSLCLTTSSDIVCRFGLPNIQL